MNSNTKNVREFYKKNKEKISKYKKEWYKEHRAEILERNRLKRLQKKIITEEALKKPMEETKKPKTPFFEILDILRKDPRHYLYGKSVRDWNQKDWDKFEILKNLQKL